MIYRTHTSPSLPRLLRSSRPCQRRTAKHPQMSQARGWDEGRWDETHDGKRNHPASRGRARDFNGRTDVARGKFGWTRRDTWRKRRGTDVARGGSERAWRRTNVAVSWRRAPRKLIHGDDGKRAGRGRHGWPETFSRTARWRWRPEQKRSGRGDGNKRAPHRRSTGRTTGAEGGRGGNCRVRQYVWFLRAKGRAMNEDSLGGSFRGGGFRRVAVGVWLVIYHGQLWLLHRNGDATKRYAGRGCGKPMQPQQYTSVWDVRAHKIRLVPVLRGKLFEVFPSDFFMGSLGNVVRGKNDLHMHKAGNTPAEAVLAD